MRRKYEQEAKKNPGNRDGSFARHEAAISFRALYYGKV